MGIKGLLQSLEEVQKPVHVSEYRTKRVAVDMYCLLHRGANLVAGHLAAGTATDEHLKYCMQRLEMLIHFGVQPIAVFDGADLPAKRGVHEHRAQQRETAKKEVVRAMRLGDTARMHSWMQRALDVTHDMAQELVQLCKNQGIEIIIAPYEADAQLAQLSLSGEVEACISDDSDLLAFGCKRVLFKMDQAGYGREICLSNIRNAPGCSEITPARFLDLCILSGCDYIKSIPGIGFKKALALLRQSRWVFARVVECARRQGFQVPKHYLEECNAARLTFIGQTVYDRERRCQRALRPLPPSVEVSQPPFLGPRLPAQMAIDIAEGRLHPVTHEPFSKLLNPKTSSPEPCPEPSPEPSFPSSQSNGSMTSSVARSTQSSVGARLTSIQDQVSDTEPMKAHAAVDADAPSKSHHCLVVPERILKDSTSNNCTLTNAGARGIEPPDPYSAVQLRLQGAVIAAVQEGDQPQVLNKEIFFGNDSDSLTQPPCWLCFRLCRRSSGVQALRLCIMDEAEPSRMAVNGNGVQTSCWVPLNDGDAVTIHEQAAPAFVEYVSEEQCGRKLIRADSPASLASLVPAPCRSPLVAPEILHAPSMPLDSSSSPLVTSEPRQRLMASYVQMTLDASKPFKRPTPVQSFRSQLVASPHKRHKADHKKV